MLKQHEEVVSNEDGSVDLETHFSSGPIQECSGCPLLIRDGAGVPIGCNKYEARTQCRIKRIVLIERL
jgi:hypothetical protein